MYRPLFMLRNSFFLQLIHSKKVLIPIFHFLFLPMGIYSYVRSGSGIPLKYGIICAYFLIYMFWNLSFSLKKPIPRPKSG